jgi:two-component system, cell cycle sensor histidine kinase and response regulator CckA
MQYIKRYIKREFVENDDALLLWRKRIFFTIFLSAILVAALSYFPNMKLSFQSRNWLNATVYTLTYLIGITVTFGRVIPFKIRAWSGLLLFYTNGLISFMTIGPAGSGRIWLFAFAVLTCLFLGLNAGFIALVLNVCTVFLYIWLLYSGYIQLLPTADFSIEHLLAIGLSFLFLSSIITISIGILVAALKKNLQKEQSLSKEFKKSNEKLEQENAERRLVQESLRRSQERFRIVSELTSDFSYCLRVEPDNHLTFEWVTEAISRITGLDNIQLSSYRSWETFIHPDDLNLKKNQIEILLSGKPKMVEYRIRSSNGNIRWLVDYGYPVRSAEEQQVLKIYGAVQDITERKLAEEALRISEEKYKTLTNNLHVGIYRNTSGPEGKFLEANPAIFEMFGYASRDEFLKIPVSDLYQRPEDRKKYTGKMLREGCVKNEELSLRKKDGSPIICSITAVAVKDENGEVQYYDGVIEDVTERKQLEFQFQQAQKLEAVGTLAGGIAHDFNNLLMVIQGNVSLMLLDLDASHPHFENIENIEKQLKRGSDLTNKLLGYARKGKYNVQLTDLNQIIKETTETFGRTKKEITIHLELAEDLLPIESDRVQIEQVLLNLFINAADAMPRGGDLTLKTRNITHTNIQGALYDIKAGKYVQLTVTDTGIGMNKKVQARIFEPFFTTKETGKGTGLGLASVYGIIKGHGGYIDVESAPNMGTTFSICLPSSDKQLAIIKKQSKQVENGSGTILLVDDEVLVLEVGAKLLQKLGYTVVEARNGKNAIELFKANCEAIDLVILDMIMPEIGGGEVFDQIKEINSGVKVLLSSGYSIDGQAAEILQRGCNDFIQKPFGLKDLSNKIKGIMAKAEEF